MPGKPRTLEFWDARRAAIIRAAREELAFVGVEGLTLEGVARRGGVSKGSVQYAFGSKDQLLGELAHDTLFSIFSDGVAAATEEPGVGLAEVIDGLTRGLAADEERLVALYALMATSRRSEATRRALSGFYAETDPRIGDALREAGALPDEAGLETLVRGVRGLVIGMFFHWVVHPQGRTLDDVGAEVRTVLARLLEPEGAASAGAP